MKTDLKRIFSETVLSLEDLSYLSRLLDTNLPISQCLKLLKNRRNEEIFERIEADLENGIMIENAIRDYLPKQIKEYMIPMLKTLSFSYALSLSLEFYERHSSSVNRLISKIAYPCILLFITVTVLYLFDLYGIDTVFSLINGFNANLEVYQGIRIIFRIVINIFYYGLLMGILLFIYLRQPKRISLLYLFISRHFPNSLICIYYSEEFISLLLTCVDKGYKTRQSLEILKQMKSKPVVSFLAFHLDESLMEGDSMSDATKKKYYDSAISRFVKIANYTNDFSNLLKSYTELAKTKIEKKIRRYTLTIQLATYSFVGIIVIFIYQILFIPMQALSAY